MPSKKIIAAGAAATAAAAAGIVAATKKKKKGAAGGPVATTYHVLPADEGWVVKAEGAERAASRHDTKKAAVQAGRNIAGKKRGTLVIHGGDGKVQRSHSYAEA